MKTPCNFPTVLLKGFNMSCGSLSPRTYGHVGYTGTMICADPDRELIAILLTNRVYPQPTADNEKKIIQTRDLWSTAIQIAYDQGPLHNPRIIS